MNTVRVYLPVGSAEYAKLYGVSTRVARTRIQAMPGAVKVGSRWQAPILATEYARRKGIKPESARKRKGALRAQNPRDLRDLVLNRELVRLRRDAAKVVENSAGNRLRYSSQGVDIRMTHASRQQLQKLARQHPRDFWSTNEYQSSDWLGDDGFSILYYH